MIKIINKELTTKRLQLRHFRKEDIEIYAEIMGDNEIGRWFPKGIGYTHEEAQKSLDNILSHWEKYGFGLWAITRKESSCLIGRCGLNYIPETSEVEIDFVLASRYWKKGYATEAAKASLYYGFKILTLDRIIALAKPENSASLRVIKKIGMHYTKNTEYWNIICAKYELFRTEYNTQFLV
jgi:ribosomal-protein-alanine N-acetyltransferase